MRSRKMVLLACGCAALGGWLGAAGMAMPPSAEAKLGARLASKTQKTESEQVFRTADMGELETKSGLHFGFTTFKAPDGGTLRVLYLIQGGRTLARAAFRQELARAVKIVEQGEKRSLDGNVVGERARILLPGGKYSAPYSASAVIWTDGPTFHEILSSSWSDILKLERVYGY